MEVNSTTGIQAWLHCLSLPRACPTRGHNHIAACSESKGHASEKKMQKKASLLQYCFGVFSEICSREHQTSPKLGKGRGVGTEGFGKCILFPRSSRRERCCCYHLPLLKGPRGPMRSLHHARTQNPEPRRRDSY